jgi:integrase
MAKMRPPAVTDEPIRVLTEDQLRTVLGICSGKTFVDRRDNAIIRLFVDTCIRRAEMAGRSVDDIDIREQVAQVYGKGPSAAVRADRCTNGPGTQPLPPRARAPRTRDCRTYGSARRARRRCRR